MVGGPISTAGIHGLTIRESATDGSDFTDPAADYRRLFLGEDGLLYTRDSAGAVAAAGSGGGAPTTADYLVGTAQGGLSAEIVVGATPGGELGGTWASPTVDATHSGSTHAATQAAAEAAAATAAAALMPWLIQILPQLIGSESASSGALTVVYHTEASPLVSATTAAGGLQTAGANTDYIEYKVPMSAGTWSCFIFVRRSTNTGIATVTVDGGAFGTIDTYAASADTLRGSITGVSVATSGLKTVRIASATKNASSSAYFLTLRGIVFLRTA